MVRENHVAQRGNQEAASCWQTFPCQAEEEGSFSWILIRSYWIVEGLQGQLNQGQN